MTTTFSPIAAAWATASLAAAPQSTVMTRSAPEGVLAAAALKCVGGFFQGRLIFRNDDERARARRTGVTDFDRKYDLHELVSKDAIFAATGVTKGAMLDGVRVADGFVSTHTLVMDSSTRTVQRIRTIRPI